MLRRVATAAFAVTVLPMATKTVHAQAAPINKDHHDGTKGFKNPWPSFVNYGFGAFFKLLTSSEEKMNLGAVKLDEKPEKVDINWNILKGKYEQLDDEIHATWLGHACIFLQMRGFNVLLDPIFSGRCSPVQFAGPKRYTDPPCKLSELPAIDAVIISHNHYDHLDVDTIKEIATRNPQCKFYVPLGNKAWFNLAQPLDSQGNDRVIELDWWESAHLKRSSNNAAELKFTCTPCQHFSGRGIFDRNKTLWASWCIEGVVEGDRTIGKVFFGGDTGYRTVPQGTKPDKQHDTEFLDTLPHCPVFKEIGEKVGPFDLALIPIGAYSPRWFMSPIHCSPEDAVELHRDVKSKHSIGIHWGTFVLTDEPVFDPPKRLKAAMENRGLNTQDFDVLPLGGTFTVKAD